MRPDRSAQAALDAYVALVVDWAPRLDLVSASDLPRFRQRHVEDSLRLLPLLEGLPPGWCIDVGSGVGLPGIPLAIADRAHTWRLLEPRRKRAAFLEEAARTLDLDCEVVVATAREATDDPGLSGGHVLAVARALAAPSEAFEMLLPLVEPEGIGVVFAGRTAKLPPDAVKWAPGLATIRREGLDNRRQ